MGADGRGKFRHPGYDSVAELDAALGGYLLRSTRLVPWENTDQQVTVGVIDSSYKLPKSLGESVDVDRRRDLLTDCNRDDTTGHGTVVCRILSNAFDNVEINLYRVIQPNQRFRERHLIQALGYAHLHDEVDIINVSAGNDHSTDGNDGCGRHNQPCKVREAVGKAISDGISVVAAAGNDDRSDSVCCPSLYRTAVSVGGSVSKCDYAPTSESDPSKPELACWNGSTGQTETLCSGRNCTRGDSSSCDQNRRNEWWSGNVEPTWNKPDVLAPAMVVSPTTGRFLTGTSWSTPFVTAAAAKVIAVVRDAGESVPPYLLRQGFEEAAASLADGEESRLDARSTLEYVGRELDLLDEPE